MRSENWLNHKIAMFVTDIFTSWYWLVFQLIYSKSLFGVLLDSCSGAQQHGGLCLDTH